MRVVVFSLVALSLLACGSVSTGSPGSPGASGSPGGSPGLPETTPSSPTSSTPAQSVPPGTSPAGDAAVNIRGTIDRRPSPSCPPGEPCDPPIVAMFVVFSQPGKPEVRLRVGAGGAFVGHLDPGSYSISAAPPPNGSLDPSEVHVPSSGTVNLHLVVRN